MLQIYRRTLIRPGCSPVDLRYIFRTPFHKNIRGGLLLYVFDVQIVLALTQQATLGEHAVSVIAEKQECFKNKIETRNSL